MKFSYIIFVLAVLISNGFVTSEEQQFRLQFPGLSSGNCSKIVSFIETYQVPYMETYKEKTWGIFYKTRVRWNYRIESRKSWRREYECCDGYTLKSGWKRNIGYYSSCEPICHPDCGNGTCIGPNVCICNYGYRTKNSVTDYTESDSFTCVPVCTSPCINGKCIAPDTCMCDSGYKLKGDHHMCEPVCDKPCPIGSFCYKPNQCLCLQGYKTKVPMPINNYELANGKVGIYAAEGCTPQQSEKIEEIKIVCSELFCYVPLCYISIVL